RHVFQDAARPVAETGVPSVVEYRAFHNSDPPRLLAVWESSGLGRGAATGVTVDAFEALNFAQPYFDPAGLIVACEGELVVGFAHAGFGSDALGTGLDPQNAVICACVVRPEHRRRGIGRELVARAEAYLKSVGAATVHAGPAPHRDPFYVGLYGGAEPAGFLASDPDADPFFRALGYEPVEHFAIYQRELNTAEPVHFRLVQVRRTTQLAIAHQPNEPSWWWTTRFGRLDSVRFLLVPKTGGAALAQATIIGLDLYLNTWNARAIGLVDLFVPPQNRRNGYGRALVLDVCKRLREEMVTRAEMHVHEADEVCIALLESAGFERVDTGTVYRKTLA
ncbi:MAG: GNAT family N-acetyltransferase, partial [Planctomycetaceae bacterium]